MTTFVRVWRFYKKVETKNQTMCQNKINKSISMESTAELLLFLLTLLTKKIILQNIKWEKKKSRGNYSIDFGQNKQHILKIIFLMPSCRITFHKIRFSILARDISELFLSSAVNWPLQGLLTDEIRIFPLRFIFSIIKLHKNIYLYIFI